MPFGAAPQIACTVEREHGCLGERRRKKGRRGMRGMVLHQRDTALRKMIADREMYPGVGLSRADQRHVIDLLRFQLRKAEARSDRGHRQAAVRVAAVQFGFFDGGGEDTVLEDGGRRVAADAADTRMFIWPSIARWRDPVRLRGRDGTRWAPLVDRSERLARH